MNNYTTIEQSKKLLELGLNPETADMNYNIDFVHKFGESFQEFPSYEKVSDFDIPCWSLGALRKLLPMGIRYNGRTSFFSCHNREDGTWVYRYVFENDRSCCYHTGTDLNACFDTVVWLLTTLNNLEK